MLPLYTLTLFVSALLLFSVQPMVGKLVLPQFGGTSAVWNTCMVFFQVLLLGGYLYAHLADRWLSARWQVRVHFLMLLTPVFFLPISFGSVTSPGEGISENLWLLTQLSVVVGVPCFVVCSSAPLLQNWFSKTNHRSASDPYFLYAASNTGSLLSLLAYPLFLEPWLTTFEQTTTWAIGYGILATLILSCGIIMRKNQLPQDAAARSVTSQAKVTDAVPPSSRTRLHWIMLAFVPSSLMLGVTTFITTDIASAPLLWVIPLALFLLTFILAFSPRLGSLHGVCLRLMPFLVLLMIPLLFMEVQAPAWLLIPIHLLTFFVVAMFCHGQLARSRPAASHLTEFYLWMSVGGVLGGVFNALVAPQCFSSVVEYPLAIALACGLWARAYSSHSQRAALKEWFTRADFAWGAGLAIGATLIMITATHTTDGGTMQSLVVFGLPALVCFAAKERPYRFAAGSLTVLMLFALWLGQQQGAELWAERGFYGVNRVVDDHEQGLRKLIHGRTVHGIQSLTSPSEPLAYYHRSGPMGDVFAAYPEVKEVGVIGLGCGAAAAYAEPGQRFTFFEIDPIVVQVASDPQFFTFLQNCQAEKQIILGDARQRIAELPNKSFDLLILDAFSSDSIPTHLLTREAFDLYLSKLRPDGILLCHVSNKFMELEPLVASMAQDLNLVCWRRFLQADAQLTAAGACSAEYLVITREPQRLEPLENNSDWKPAKTNPNLRLWTDDYSNVMSVFRW